MSPRTRMSAALGATLAIAALVHTAAAGQKPPPDLSGTWRMDLAQSQPPLDAEVSRRQARGVAIGGMPVGSGGHGGGSGTSPAPGRAAGSTSSTTKATA